MGTIKYSIFFVFLFFCHAANSQELEVLEWNAKRKLTWADFKGQPMVKQSVAALTASGISYQFSTDWKGGELEVDFVVTTYFYPERSWYRPELCDDVILSHEQLHFDISELFTRKMRERLAKANFSKNVKAEVNKIYVQVIKELNQFQNQYDKETNFSRNREQQLLWNQKVTKLLSSG